MPTPKALYARRPNDVTDTLSLVLILLAIGATSPRRLRAQSVTTVRVPQSIVTRTSADAAKESLADAAVACRVTVKAVEAKRGASGGETVRDELRLDIQDDRNQTVAAPANLTFRVGAQGGYVAKGSTPKPLVADSGASFSNVTLEMWRTDDQVRVCSATLKRAAADTAPDDTTRYPFRVGVGASFTPLAGSSNTDLYYDVTIFLPDAFRTSGGHRSRWGIDAGLTNGRLGLRADTTPEMTTRVNVFRPTRDSVATIARTFTSARTLSVENLRLYLGPTLRLSPALYWVLHAETNKRDYTSKTHDRVTELDTSVTAGTQPPAGTPRTVRPPTADVAGDTLRVRRYTEYDAFFGSGPLVIRRQSTVEFRAKAVFGVGPLAGATKGQYLVTFRITDFATGFKLGGEVRGILKNTEPALFVFLAKDFDFKKLAGFITSGNGS